MQLKSVFSLFFMLFWAKMTLWAQSDHVLWYQRPAEYFEETLVLGNGKMGASVFGGVEKDKILLNDATLWSGEPVQPNMNPEAYKHLPEIRAALQQENYPLADALNKKLQGSFSQSYAPLGTLNLDFGHSIPAQNYYRELDLSKAVSLVRYSVGGVDYEREYFISHPDQVMVIRLKSSKKGALHCAIGFESQLKYEVSNSSTVLEVNGYAPIHAAPSYLGDIPNAVIFDAQKGTRFTTLVHIKDTDGNVRIANGQLLLEGATTATVVLSVATSFNGFDQNPATHGVDNKALAANVLKAVLPKKYTKIKQKHLRDYQSFYQRLYLNLGPTSAPNLPTDERLQRYSKGAEDKNLEVLYFQFGRYLMIASSRTNGVPANLQGIWNPHLRPPWSSNYTININAEENYWLCESGNLSEMHQPLLTFVENVAKTGAVTAQTFYGAKGWVACHNSDIWAMSNPVGDFGKGDPVWANWNMGGTWLSTHLWEHYAFSRDKHFLATKGYPLMKGAAQFCLDWLVEDKDGYLITSPCTSPENVYITPSGYKGATLYGGTADIAMIRECFEQTLQAAKVLGVDLDFQGQLQGALGRLLPYRVGAKGHLQEWYYDWLDAEPQHRHQSHLFGLFPGHQITPDKTPDLAAACRTTLEVKGDETTGWSKGWRINLWARLWEGNRAYKMYRELLHYVEPDGVKTSYERGGGTYPNLFDAHPPFQIDGNFGGAAAVLEMLVQSDEDAIRLLPALPDAWSQGAVRGIRTRGGFEIDMEWEDKKIKKMNILAKNGGKTTVFYQNKQKIVDLKKGQRTAVTW